MEELIFYIWLLGIIIIVYKASRILRMIWGKKSVGTHNRRKKTIDTMPMITEICAEKVKEIDPNFSAEKMLASARNLFVKMQDAWTSRDWEPMRVFETQSLFEQHKNQLQSYIDANQINIRDRVKIEYAYLYKFRQEGDRDILEIALKTTMRDYVIDATTKHVLKGDETSSKTTIDVMTFERKTGVLTPEETEKIKTTNCPNCGAPTQITSAGKCEYCASVITTSVNSWVLVALGPLRN